MRIAGSSARDDTSARDRAQRHPRAALLAVTLVFVALASLVAVKTPAWEPNDEASHVQNIETLVGGHWYRIPPAHACCDSGFANYELHQPPLYYLLLAGFQRAARQPARAVNPGPPSVFALEARRGIYAHHSSADLRFLLLLRFPNVFLGLLTVWFTFLTARLLSRDRWTPVVAAATVAFTPRFVFLSAAATNDNLVNTLAAALAYASVCAVLPPSRWKTAAVGAILGLLTITKLSALPAVTVLVPVVFASRAWNRRAQALAIACAALLAISGWYLVQNDVRYGDPFAIAASKDYLTAVGGLGTFHTPYVVTHPLRLIFFDVPSKLFRGFWHKSTLPAYYWPWTTSLVFWLVLAFAVAGLRPATPRPDRRPLIVLITLAAAGFLSVWIVAFNTAAYDARLALLALPSLACLAALGLERWKPPVRFVLPLLGLCGTIVAIQQDVLSVHWTQ